MSTILVVDDDVQVQAAFAQILSEQGHEVVLAGRGDEAVERVASLRPDLVIMDICMPGLTGLEAFQQIKRVDPRLPVVIMTGYSTTQTAIEATKLGAFDYHLKPIDPEDLLRTMQSALESVRLMRRPVELDARADVRERDAIIGQSAGMREVYKAIGRVAPTEANVLIRGQTGTGKELVARAIYQHSRRADAPMVVVNCAAIPDPLLESELFGHESGAFTGAQKRRIGRFEQAAGGTLLLDEIGDMSPAIQAKLLRLLQERSFERVGGNETLSADVRVLAATNRDLEAAMARGEFRQDLFHRLAVFTIHLPALRERPEDIPELARCFVARFARELELAPPVLAPEALELLARQAWPGNVRELQHCVQRAMISRGGFPIQAEDVQQALASIAQPAGPALAGDDQSNMRQIVQSFLRIYAGPAAHDVFLDMAEKLLLSAALEIAGGNQTHAARLLGMARPTLKARMDRHGLRPNRPE